MVRTIIINLAVDSTYSLLISDGENVSTAQGGFKSVEAALGAARELARILTEVVVAADADVEVRMERKPAGVERVIKEMLKQGRRRG